jgi:hypothetical protein
MIDYREWRDSPYSGIYSKNEGLKLIIEAINSEPCVGWHARNRKWYHEEERAILNDITNLFDGEGFWDNMRISQIIIYDLIQTIKKYEREFEELERLWNSAVNSTINSRLEKIEKSVLCSDGLQRRAYVCPHCNKTISVARDFHKGTYDGVIGNNVKLCYWPDSDSQFPNPIKLKRYPKIKMEVEA